MDVKIISKEIKMENNEGKKQEESTKVETPVVNGEPVKTTEVKQPVNSLINATVKELDDKAGFRG